MALENIKSIRDTYIFQVFNKGGGFDNPLKTLLTKGIVADKTMLDVAYNTINNYYKYALKQSVLNALDEGIIKPMFFPKGITAVNKVPTSIPFILTQSNGVLTSVAIIDNYVQIMDNGPKPILIIDPSKLYTILEGAFVARGIQLNFNAIRNKTVMYKLGAATWAHMFTRVLNRPFALNVSRDAQNKVLFLSAKYFLINILQLKDSDQVFNYAVQAANGINPILVKQLNDLFKAEDYTNISTFVQAIAKNAYAILNGIDKLTVRDYIKDFINIYHNSALFSLEHLSYFLFNVIATVNHAHINNQVQFEEALGMNNGESLYAQIANSLVR